MQQSEDSAKRAFRELESGLDALELNVEKKRDLRSSILRAISPVLALAFLILIWHLALIIWEVENYILPTPVEVFSSLKNQWELGNLQQAVLTSFTRGLQGFLLAILLATPLGLLLGLSKPLRTLFGPILLGLQQLPSVAWVPAAIIWFGLSPATIYAVILLGAIPSIANGLISGIDQINPIFSRVSKVLGASRIQNIRLFILPASWPGYLAGLEQGWAFAWRSLMAAELIAVSPALGLGVGQLLDVGRQLGDMSLVIAAILLILVIGVFVERIIFAPLRNRTLKRRGLLRK